MASGHACRLQPRLHQQRGSAGGGRGAWRPVAVDAQQRASELRLIIQRANPASLLLPALPAPLGEVIDEFTLVPGTARDYVVAPGQYIQVLDVAGRQCSDFVAFDRRGLDAGREIDLDPTVTRTLNGNAYPAPACSASSSTATCSQCWKWCATPLAGTTPSPWPAPRATTKHRGYFGHTNCSDNISRALAAHGVQAGAAGRRSTFLQHRVDAHQQLTSTSPGRAPATTCCSRPCASWSAPAARARTTSTRPTAGSRPTSTFACIPTRSASVSPWPTA
uniref:DUF1989 domain-containing protein n=1 Tax=Ectopseudomonas oleovorans TaxID=301 RepID=A0A653AXG6_ECTOL